ALVRSLGGGAHAPAPAALERLLAQGHGTLGGARLTRAGLLLREEAGLAPPAPARPGALWDGRFRLEGAPPPGWWLGALGPGARSLARPGWLPAAVAPTLPALFRPAGPGLDGDHRDTVLAAVPALSYPVPQITNGIRLRLAPLGGAVVQAL
ncbi:hypothetical protein HEQ75_22910, partial [Roseomonas sp. BU-1]|nr:hypothetical protein [Falsiroseomonas selenitidurans]